MGIVPDMGHDKYHILGSHRTIMAYIKARRQVMKWILGYHAVYGTILFLGLLIHPAVGISLIAILSIIFVVGMYTSNWKPSHGWDSTRQAMDRDKREKQLRIGDYKPMPRVENYEQTLPNEDNYESSLSRILDKRRNK